VLLCAHPKVSISYSVKEDCKDEYGDIAHNLEGGRTATSRTT
jgi:hypothetical protein